MRAAVGGEGLDGLEVVAAGKIFATGVRVVEALRLEDLLAVAMRAANMPAVLGAAAAVGDKLGAFKVGLGENAEEGIVGGGKPRAHVIDNVDPIEHAGDAALGNHVFNVVEEAVAQGFLREEAGGVGAAELDDHVEGLDPGRSDVEVLGADAAAMLAEEGDNAIRGDFLGFVARLENVEQAPGGKLRKVDGGVDGRLAEAALRRFANERLVHALPFFDERAEPPVRLGDVAEIAGDGFLKKLGVGRQVRVVKAGNVSLLGGEREGVRGPLPDVEGNAVADPFRPG